MKKFVLSALVVLGLAVLPVFCWAENDSFRERIEADWERQESHYQRTSESPAAFRELCERARNLQSSLEENELIDASDQDSLAKKLDEMAAIDPDQLSPQQCRDTYRELRWFLRGVIFHNPLLKDTPIAFMKGNRFGYQILQDYLSYYIRYTNQHGGGLYILKNPGKSFEVTDLTTGHFPRGHFSTPSLSWDAKTLYFAFADLSKVQDENAPMISVEDLIAKGEPQHMEQYLKESEGKYHLFQMELATGATKQLTDGPNDDFDPALLPNGNIVFVSTRRGGFARCNMSWEPIMTATLHELLPDGTVKCLSWHETNEWTPTVLHDGRIVYCRWDYVDRSASRYQGLWITNPDGTQATSLFGNYTEDVVVCIQPEPIPDSQKIMFVAAGHHLSNGGSLVILDPSKVKYDPETGFDLFDSIERVTPEIPFPETKAPGSDSYLIPEQYYYSPFPLSEDYYLVSYSHDALGGYLSSHGGTIGSPNESGKLGLYYRDRFGNLELMYEDDQYNCRYPIPLAARPVPETIPARWSEPAPKDGTFVLTNVYESLFPFPQGRKIKELRVFEILSKFPSHTGNVPPIGHDFAGNARAFLGTVPVEEDGSAHFQVPACKPLYFQAVDEEGKAVQTMLTEVYLQPGENRGCIGCHEQAQTILQNAPEKNMALQRPASQLIPGPEGTQPFSYPLLIQPILDRACLDCHHDRDGHANPVLTGQDQAEYTISYQNLKPYLRWYEWLDATIRRTVSLPGECGVDMSPITKILEDENHAGKMNLSDGDKRILYLWIDGNIPFYGSYVPEDRERQRRGESIPIPQIP